MPLLWAESQNNLGTALLSLGQREAGTAALRRAVRTRGGVAGGDARAPAARLGDDLDKSRCGPDGGRHARCGYPSLDRAVATLRDALTEGTRERVPLGWAETQYYLGNALLERGRRTADETDLEGARTAMSSLLDFVKPMGDAAQDAHLAARIADIDAALAGLN